MIRLETVCHIMERSRDIMNCSSILDEIVSPLFCMTF